MDLLFNKIGSTDEPEVNFGFEQFRLFSRLLKSGEPLEISLPENVRKFGLFDYVCFTDCNGWDHFGLVISIGLSYTFMVTMVTVYLPIENVWLIISTDWIYDIVDVRKLSPVWTRFKSQMMEKYVYAAAVDQSPGDIVTINPGVVRDNNIGYLRSEGLRKNNLYRISEPELPDRVYILVRNSFGRTVEVMAEFFITHKLCPNFVLGDNRRKVLLVDSDFPGQSREFKI
ncbi:MAG: hypothetical protein NTZ80_02855 [Patescibacteria group bacterium]|nr:hypothetical protein [Patescibacteria group bacterium]